MSMSRLILCVSLLVFALLANSFVHAAVKQNAASQLPSVTGGNFNRGKTSKLQLHAAAAGKGTLGGKATVSSSVFNLAKSIVGIGVLSLPGGVAYMSDSPAALVPACIVGTLMGSLAGYCFSLIGKSCEKHQTNSFQDAWGKSVDPKSGWLISFGITAKCILASLACSIIIGMNMSIVIELQELI